MEVISTMDVVYRCCAGLDVHKQSRPDLTPSMLLYRSFRAKYQSGL